MLKFKIDILFRTDKFHYYREGDFNFLFDDRAVVCREKKWGDFVGVLYYDDETKSVKISPNCETFNIEVPETIIKKFLKKLKVRTAIINSVGFVANLCLNPNLDEVVCLEYADEKSGEKFLSLSEIRNEMNKEIKYVDFIDTTEEDLEYYKKEEEERLEEFDGFEIMYSEL